MSLHYVASGFLQDMEELFSRFLTPDEESKDKISTDVTNFSLRFSRFSRCWRQMKFSLVFRHRMNENDLREFVEEIYLLVLPNVCTEYPYERRVGALYLLYSLFVKQPKSIGHKIRINLSFLQQIRELIHTSKVLEQMDVCFVWYQLWSLGAVDLVVAARHMGPYFIRNIRVTPGTERKTDFLIDQFKTSIYLPFNELNQIHDKYRTFKEELSKEVPIMESQEFNAIYNDIFDLNKSMAELLDKLNDNHLDKGNNKLMGTSTTNGLNQCNENQEMVAQDIGARRRQLKERALNCKTNTSNGKTTQIERRYGPITEEEINTEKRKKAIGKRGRPKVAKLNAIL